MFPSKHIAFYITSKDNKEQLQHHILSGDFFKDITDKNVAVFSEKTLNKFISEEMRHGNFQISTKVNNSLYLSSEGERKQALLNYLISQAPDYLILDNVFGSLDQLAQATIKRTLQDLSKSISVIQITNRKSDILEFIEEIYEFKKGTFSKFISTENSDVFFSYNLPPILHKEKHDYSSLIEFNKVSVSYGERAIIRDITWKVECGDFWKLSGPNGSGKSTMLSMIYGDNPKAYGQDIKLFDVPKGSGESIWDIKKKIGYFSSDMVRGFARHDSIGNMIVSGFHDSIGLYKMPTNIQIQIAHQWLKVLGMFDKRKKSFSSLSKGHQRMVLIARAMVKQPPLLILDEPTNGLDDHDARLFSELINKIASETDTAIIFVSHRRDEVLKPDFIFELFHSKYGSTGSVQKNKTNIP